MNKLYLSAVLIAVFFIMVIPVYSETDKIEFYVSCSNGSDSYVGTIANPFKTLQKAQTEIRKLKASGLLTKQVFVYIRQGTYEINSTISFDNNDSGTGSCPITYTSYNNENVILSGGVDLPYSAFTSVSTAVGQERISPAVMNQIKQIDLRSLGITDFGTIAKRGNTGTNTDVAEAELFVDEAAMTLARWPDKDKFAVNGYCSNNSANNETSVKLECFENRQGSWIDGNGTLKEKDGKIEAFTAAEYRTASANIIGIDSETGYIVTSNPNDYGFGFGRQRRYYVFNILEELDNPGEYYIDRDNGILYYYPQTELNENSDIKLSMARTVLLSLTNVSYINFKGIKMTAGRCGAIQITDSTNVQFLDCIINHMGTYGINVSSGYNVCISGCKLYYIGRKAVTIGGGNFETLEKAYNCLEYSEIHSSSRRSETSVSAVGIAGVGNQCIGNKIYDMPHQAVTFSGLKHEISHNEVYDVCKKVSDAGAIYSGRSWSNRENEISYNYFHDFYGYYKKDTVAIYLDDMMSGALIKGNAFVDCGGAVFVSGGRDNIVTENFIFNCEKSIRCIAFWGINDTKWYSKTGTDSDNLYYRLTNLSYLNKLMEEYPEVEYLYYEDPHPEYPKNNTIKDNVVYNSKEIEADNLVVEYGSIDIQPSKHIVMYTK